MARTTLRENWFLRDIADHIDLNAAGVYEWRIDGVGVYVGKAKKLKSRLQAYPRNVRRMLEGLPWHGNPAREYRRIHHALRQAYESGATVRVAVLEVCDPKERAEREIAWIAKRQEEAAAGGPPLLNL